MATSHAVRCAMTGPLLDKSLVYVTGKGGVGKTTVAAAIGLASAARGRRTIVCEVAHQDRVSRAFAREGVHEEVEVELEHDLWAITIDPEEALREWLAGQVGDAPASGHGLAMLTTPRTFGEIARVGPIRRQAFKIRDMLADPARTGYVAVALPEEMPVNETLELEQRLHGAVGAGLDAIVVNAVFPSRFSKAEAERLRAAADNGHRPE